MTHYWLEARQERDRAEKERNHAEASLGRVFKVLDESLRRANAPEIRDSADLRPYRVGLHQDTLSQLQEFVTEMAGNPRVEEQIGMAQVWISDIEREAGHESKALEAGRNAVAVFERLVSQGHSSALVGLAFASKSSP